MVRIERKERKFGGLMGIIMCRNRKGFFEFFIIFGIDIFGR